MQHTTLPSGQRVLTIPVPEMPVVAIQVFIGAGSCDEAEDEHGLAHLHEHMLFKGTAKDGVTRRGVGEVAEAVEAVGGQINAWTSYDQTCYHVVMPAAAWQTGLEVLADAVCHPAFDADELAREIEVVVEEQRRAADDPGSVAFETLFSAAFPGHPYARPILGTAQSVRATTPAAMRAFWRRHYTAENTLVVAAGAVDADDFAAAVAAHFADQPHRLEPAASLARLPRPAAGVHIPDAPFSEARVLLAWPVPSHPDPDVAALDVAAILLGQGDSSRLVRVVQRERELCNDIGAGTWTPPRAGLLTVSFATSAERLEPALVATLEVIQEMRANGVESSEVAKAVANLQSDAIWKRETAQGLAQGHGMDLLLTGDAAWERRYLDHVAELRRGDIQRVMQRWLTADAVQVVILPGQSDATLPESAALLQTVRAHLRPVAAALALREPDVLDGLERVVLPSGDVLIAQPDASVPVWGLRVAALGGLLAEPAHAAGRSLLQGSLLTRGTSRWTGDDIAAQVEGLAAGIQGSAGRNSVGLGAISLRSTTDAVLELACACLFDAALPRHEFHSQRNVQLEDIRHEADNPASRAGRAMGEALFAGHPYGHSLLGTAETLAGLDPDTTLADLRGRLAPGQLTWAVSGDIDVAHLVEALAAHTPTDRQPLGVPPRPPLQAPRERQRIHLPADKQQAHGVLGFLGVSLHDPDRHALEVLATLLGGQSGRLFLELRDRQSLAYSVGAHSVDGVDPGYFSFYIGTTPDKVPQALAGLYAEIDRVRQTVVRPEELARARAALAGMHQIGLQRRLSRATVLCMNELYGLGRAAWHGYLQALLAVRAEDVLSVAQRRLDPEHAVEVLLAPRG